MKKYNPAAEFAAALYATPARGILVQFAGRQDREPFTYNVLSLLKTEPDVIDIIDAETGELVYIR